MAFQTFVLRTKFMSESHAVLRKGTYPNGQLALQVTSQYGEPLCTATVNLEAYGEMPREGMVFIKDANENEGLVECLHEADIIGQPERWIDAGYVKAYAAECPLLVEVSE